MLCIKSHLALIPLLLLSNSKHYGFEFVLGGGIFSVKVSQTRIMSAHAGGMCMSQCKHWRIL